MLESGEGYDSRINNGNTIRLYNPGVKETDFILTFSFVNKSIPAGGIILDSGPSLYFDKITAQDEDDQIKINTKLNLIEGYKNGIKSGKIYNEFVNSGTYFKIPVGRDMILTIDNAKGL
jgi:hypothetical protein